MNAFLVSALLCVLAHPALSNPQLTTESKEISVHFYMPIGSVPLEGGRAEDWGDDVMISYELELPNDCEKLNRLANAPGVDMHGVTLDLVVDASDFCARVEMLYRGAPSANIDFVSDLDFTDLPLTLVPYEMNCFTATRSRSDLMWISARKLLILLSFFACDLAWWGTRQ